MTDEQIDAMEAGPEMDRLVAGVVGDTRQGDLRSWISSLDGSSRALSKLTFREREVVKLRFGIGYESAFTLEESGRIFKCTRERIRQIENKAVEKLKGMSSGEIFVPSRDWNDAMFAAERFGLFDCYREECQLSYDGAAGSIADSIQWVVWYAGTDEQELCAHAGTGPLAICRAILKLHAGAGR